MLVLLMVDRLAMFELLIDTHVTGLLCFLALSNSEGINCEKTSKSKKSTTVSMGIWLSVADYGLNYLFRSYPRPTTGRIMV